jgi:TetR/AcrR family transcriptional regulator, regulator of biofilm formation and stress response
VASAKKQRRNDPDRRRRIAEAALRVIEDRGVEGLTHRAVAAAADVPLGSTTYYFKDKDDLLASALEVAERRTTQMLTELLARFVEGADLAAGLAELTEELTLRQRGRLVLDYQLYLAALYRPAIRPLSARWAEETLDVISPRTDPLTASALGFAFEGVLFQSILLDKIFLAADVEPIYRRIVAS